MSQQIKAHHHAHFVSARRIAALILAAQCPFSGWASQIRDIAVHRVPLRTHDVHAPFCYAVSSPSDLSSDQGSTTANFLATQAWPSARVAAQCLIQHMNPQWTVLEAGCGPGLPSLTAASLGSPRVYATDVEPLALELVEKAGSEQGWQERIETFKLDLTDKANEINMPKSDLYLLSDVFESRQVAEGAAHWVDFILRRFHGSKVWVFAQTDRSQKEIFLQRLQQIRNDKSLKWESYSSEDFAKDVENQLWLCSIDETKVSYG